METFIANLKQAIRNNETVSIGGGEFNTTELKDLLKAVELATKVKQSLITIDQECDLAMAEPSLAMVDARLMRIRNLAREYI